MLEIRTDRRAPHGCAEERRYGLSIVRCSVSVRFSSFAELVECSAEPGLLEHYGRTAGFARAQDERASGVQFVAGLHVWF